MIIIYRPEGGDEQTWDLDEVKANFAEGRAFEKAAGCEWSDLQEKVQGGNLDALQAVLWILRKRGEPNLTLRELDELPMDAMAWRYGAAERKLMRTLMEKNDELDDEAKQVALAMLDAADEDEPAEAEPDPKETPAPKAKKAAASKRSSSAT